MESKGKFAINRAENYRRFADAGFKLFAEKGIEAVTLKNVADEAGLGIATLYKYYGNKTELVIDVGTRRWEEFFTEVEEDYARRGGELMNAAEELEFYLGEYILLYREHRDILRFNQNFNSYIMHENVPKEQLAAYLKAVGLYAAKFGRLYKKGLEDGTIRTDEPAETMFNTTMHTMLAVGGRFAQGVVYHGENREDLTQELICLKRMMLNSYIS